MKKNIYYVVDKELRSYGNFEETTGNKTVTTYNVKNGEIKESFSLGLTNEDNSEEEIIDYLIDNGHIEESTECTDYSVYYEELKFIQL